MPQATKQPQRQPSAHIGRCFGPVRRTWPQKKQAQPKRSKMEHRKATATEAPTTATTTQLSK